MNSPVLLLQCFPGQGPGLDPQGQYEVRLFDPDENFTEVSVPVNDLIPMMSHMKRGADADNWTPLYLRPYSNELFMLLLEKAVAKLLGGYEALEAGTALYAWSMLTGCEECMSIQHDDDEWNEMEVTDVTWAYGYRGNVTSTYDDTELLTRLLELAPGDGSPYVVGVSVGATGIA